MTQESTDEQAIRESIRSWAEAVHAGDLDATVAGRGDGIVMFDVPPPERGVRGMAEYREIWPAFFDWQRTGASFDPEEIEVVAGGDVAFAWALLRCGTPEELTREPGKRLRISFGLRREGDRWVVLHEHHSFTQTG
ncbi:YybH family protein [Microlunatus speluncae]|uniref:YybH family protein n=1 Tax=Microlunatus speluncae TaxID=2594267 RepID=UPI0012664249|nr:nuclear transport factor 2 family protein [Microlunatus speluncae]